MKSILTFLLLTSISTVSAAAAKYLTYEEFIDEVEAGNVQSVTVSEYSVMGGTLTEDGQTKEFFTFSETGSASDPLLKRLLDAHGVQITFKQTMDIFDMMLGCIFILFPLVMLVLLLVILKKVNKLQKLLIPPVPNTDGCDYDNTSPM